MPLVIPILVLLGLLLLVSPILIIVLFVKESNLRTRLRELAEDYTRKIAQLQRTVAELQNKVAAMASESVREQGAREKTRDEKPVVEKPPVEKPAAQETTHPSRTPRTFAPVPTPPVVSLPPKVELPVPPPIAEPMPASQIKPEAFREPKPQTPQSPTPPILTTPPATTMASAPARSSAPRLAIPQSVKSVRSIEQVLGTSWFAILGVIMTVIGLALLGKLALQNMGPGGKAFLIYAVSIFLLGGGVFLEKRERYRVLGRVAIGGGWALLFFSTFGIHFVPAMRVLDSGVDDSVLMLAIAVAMAAHTLRYKSQFVTGVAFLLGYSTVALSQDTVYSLTAGAMLAIGLVAIVLKMGWFELEVFGIISTYLNHLYWLYRILGVEGAHGRSFPEYHASLALLFFYWLTFRASYVARDIKSDFEEHVSTVAAVLNTLLVLALMKFQSVQPELAYLGLLAVGAMEFVAAQLPLTRRRRRAFVLLSVMGAALLIAAAPSHYSGNKVAILWLIGAEVFLAAGIIFKEVVFRRLGLLTGLLVGADLVGFNLRPPIGIRTHSEALALTSGVLFAVCGVAFYFNSMFASLRWKEEFRESFDSNCLIIQSYLGAFSAATAAWAFFANDWTAIAFAAIMLGIAALHRHLAARHLRTQTIFLGILTLYRAVVFNFHLESPAQVHISTRLITLPLLGAIFYAVAKLLSRREESGRQELRALFSFSGSFLLAYLIWSEAPDLWMAALFLAAGIVLAVAARRWNLLHLSVQEHIFAAAAVWKTLDYYNNAPGHFGPLSLRLITVSIVAAGLYAISRKATPLDAAHSRIAAYLHTTAATGLLALLMWYEVSSGWVVACWAVFALALSAIDRRFEMSDLRWQAHALAAITMLRCIGVNLHDEAAWHGLSVRLISLTVVALVFYGMALLIRMPEEWRDRDFHHVYSWAASFLTALLLWYELQPLSIAVGMGVFGLVLFEYGLLRKIAQFRYQAYVVFVAAFARIFFANLAAGAANDWFGPRVYTVLPLILIFFFVYTQLSAEPEAAPAEARSHSADLAAYLGTGALAALFYFQFPAEWVVTAYAGLAFALYGIAWAWKREVFLHHAILLTLATFARAMSHNLFGASHFGGGTWTGRYFVLSTAVALLLASLIFAFRLRAAYKASARAPRHGKIAAFLIGQPEQLVFLVAVILVTVMLALKTTAMMITVSWGIEALLIVLLALAVRERSFLQIGFGLLVLCAGKIFAMDMWRLDLLHGTITFIGVGLATTAASLLYIRYQDNLKRYL